MLAKPMNRKMSGSNGPKGNFPEIFFCFSFAAGSGKEFYAQIAVLRFGLKLYIRFHARYAFRRQLVGMNEYSKKILTLRFIKFTTRRAGVS